MRWKRRTARSGLGSALLLFVGASASAACSDRADHHPSVVVHPDDSGSAKPSKDAGVDAGGPSGREDDAGATGTAEPYCPFGPGASVEQTLGFGAAQRGKLPIDHVIVVMKENHSYDQYFGQLYRHGQPDSEPLPDDFTNLDTMGQPVKVFHATSTCPPFDPDHQWMAMHAQVNGGRMDGFVTSAAKYGDNDGHYVMGYFDDTDLPFYYFLANTFAIADHHFASARTGTWPNRGYFLLGTSDGVDRTGGGCPSPDLPSLMSEIEDKGLDWASFSVTEPFEGTLCWPSDHPGQNSITSFYNQLAAGTLPHLAFVDGKENVEDEHPTANVQVGEAWTRKLYEAVVASPLWPTVAVIFTYDEAGGFFDHVPPGNACVARPQDARFFELGMRVPLIAISPWAKPHFVSHVPHEHTSISRFIELVFDLPALTARDANSDALLDMFDWESPPRMTPPAAPAAGTGGCKR